MTSLNDTFGNLFRDYEIYNDLIKKIWYHTEWKDLLLMINLTFLLDPWNKDPNIMWKSVRIRLCNTGWSMNFLEEYNAKSIWIP